MIFGAEVRTGPQNEKKTKWQYLCYRFLPKLPFCLLVIVLLRACGMRIIMRTGRSYEHCVDAAGYRSIRLF